MAQAEGRALDLRDVLGRLPHGDGGDGSAEDLAKHLGIRQGRRRAAFVKLFNLWNERDRVLMFTTNGSFLVSVDARDGGEVWRVWEKPDEGATYLFRPAAERLESFTDWLGSDDFSRRRLRSEPGLQAAQGFVGRVLHLDGDRELSGWWRDLMERIGRG